MQIRDRFDALFPSYFEDLVRFIAEQMGLQVDYFVKTKSNDGGIDLRGWRSKGIFEKRVGDRDHFCFQVKRREITRDDLLRLHASLLPGETGILVTSKDTDIEGKNPGLFDDHRVRIVQGKLLAEYVLEYYEKLPTHLARIFKIVRIDL